MWELNCHCGLGAEPLVLGTLPGAGAPLLPHGLMVRTDRRKTEAQARIVVFPMTASETVDNT